MKALARALHAESLKLKRTLALRVVVIAPLLVVLLQFFAALNRAHAPSEKVDGWAMISSGVLALWAVFMLPLFITLETVLLASIEHHNVQWKHLAALPGPRSAVFLAKWTTAALLSLAATLALATMLLVAGNALAALRADLFTTGGPNPAGLFLSAAKVWIASWLLISIHTSVSIRWSSVAVTLGSGVAGTFFALFAASARLGEFYPWLLPLNTLAVSGTAAREGTALWLGSLGGLLGAAIGCVAFARRAGDPTARA